MAITKHDHYHTEIDKLIGYLEHDTNSPDTLDKLQAHLDKLAEHYQNDESLGSERYKLYQAQAMLSYRTGDLSKARGFIQEAVNVRGQSYELAEQLLAHLNDGFTPKPTVRWVVLMALPIPLFLVVALTQLITHFVLNKTTADGTTGVTNLSSTTVNLFSVIVGAAAAVMILLIPVWAMMLVKAKRYNSSYGYGLSKRAGVVIAAPLTPPFPPPTP